MKTSTVAHSLTIPMASVSGYSLLLSTLPANVFCFLVSWLGLVVEIDGAQHRQGLAVTEDNLRQNSVALTSDVVLRIDLIGLRIEAQRFMDQVDEAHRVLARRRSA